MLGGKIMQGKTHCVIGTAAAMSALKPSLGVIIMAAAGSLIVDMDIKSSKASKAADNISKVIILGIIVTAVVDKYFNTSFLMSAAGTVLNFSVSIAAAAIWFLLKCKSSHRGFTHSIFGMLLICFASFAIFDFKLSAALAIGYACHITADLFNKKGCQLFYPNKKRYCLKLCRSDGKVDGILFFTFFMVCVFEIGVFAIRNINNIT